MLFYIIGSIYWIIGSIFAGIRINKDLNIIIDPDDDILDFKRKRDVVVFIILIGIDLSIKFMLISFLWPILLLIRKRGTLSFIAYLLW